MSKIVVLGGSGFIGTHVCEKIVEDRQPGSVSILVPTRRLGHARHLLPLPGLDTEQADVFDAPQLERLLAGADVVVNLVGILQGRPADFQRVHVGLPERLVRACRQTGVRRVVHISALGAAADAPSHYLRSKAAGETALRTEPGLQLTVLRPSVVFGEGDRFLTVFAGLQRRFPVLPLAAAGARFQPVWVEDLARAVVCCIDEPWRAGQVYECVGPRSYTLAELVRLAGQWTGHERRILPLPAALGRLQALLLEALPGEPLMSRDNLASMQVDNIASGRLPALEALGIVPAALEAVAPRYLADPGLGRRVYVLRATARRG
ncbi:complex I NDUFA9 subunit family protein [Aquabacterium sp. A7-Y]|uniref:complex I NDUFA9 subunit family protein n=1 Tax=Aquabacterium sp. A7-Y TaxID=1349605 RepID=UPI00223E4A20|nr:complex I NDUFA9 subunit family protein [Aquabacterium sp. A7-Y]MCW7539309.1 complex I NDUFA9 subunit family protein [Aquabacterium sp. A7-Y]